MEPWEINEKIQAYNKRLRDHQKDIYDLATLVAVGVNNPKSYPKTFEKWYPDKQSKKVVKKDEKIVKGRLKEIGFDTH